MTVFTDVWATLFLEKVYQLDYLTASQAVAWIINGIAFGAIGIGWLATSREKINKFMIALGALAFVASLCIIFKATTDLFLLRILGVARD